MTHVPKDEGLGMCPNPHCGHALRMIRGSGPLFCANIPCCYVKEGDVECTDRSEFYGCNDDDCPIHGKEKWLT